MFSPFDTIPACDRRTDRQTQCHSIYRASIASRGSCSAVIKSANNLSDHQYQFLCCKVSDRIPVSSSDSLVFYVVRRIISITAITINISNIVVVTISIRRLHSAAVAVTADVHPV